MPGVLQKCEMILYAEDTVLFTQGNIDKQSQDNMIHHKNNLNKWLKINKLNLNETKIKQMQKI